MTLTEPRTVECSPAGRVTRSLLGYGVIAGPFYVVVSLAQALTRDGFALDRHAWSLLENGGLGWIQITNFVLTGLMTVAGAVGVRRALSTFWAPVLLGVYGAGLVGAGVFRADPAAGFPVGTHATTAISWHGALHLACGAIGFAGLVAAGVVLGSRFARSGQVGLAWFSRVAAVTLLLGFVGVASGSHGPATLGFVAAIVLVSAWISTLSVHLYRITH